MFPVLQAYKDKEWSAPKQGINPAEKQAEYHRKQSQFIYSLFCRNKTAFTSDSYSQFERLRLYSIGKQDVEQYKTSLSGDSLTNSTSNVAVDSFDSTPLSRISRKEGWYNSCFENISPAPTILNALHGQFDKLDFDLYCNVIDPESKDLEENEAYLKLFEGQNLDWQNEYKQKAGIPIDENTYYPKSVQEFEMFKAQDGFKLNVAKSMQKILRHSFTLRPGAWDTVTRKKVVDDLIVLKYGAVRDYFDAEDNKFKQKWIDPARLVMQFSNEYDYNDSEYGGYFSLWTVSNLKQKLPEVPEENWYSLAKGCLGNYGNPTGDWESRYSDLDPSTKTYGYDGFKVPVFETEWIDADITKRKYYTDRYGRQQVKDLSFEDTEKSSAKSKVKNISVRLVRQCNWVVGTDYCFDWGVLKMASRKGYSKPQLTFHVEQLLQPSIMEQLVPILDQIELNFLRYQNSLAKMVENGYAINTTMLGNVTLGGNKLKPAEVIKLFKQTGFFLYQYSAGTGLYTGGAATPITAIDGGMKNRVEETIKTLDMWMGTIKTMTGIDVVALSSQPQTVDTEEGMKEQVQITQDVLKPILDATSEIKQSVGESLMRRIQIGVRNSESIRKAYAGVISNADMEALVRMESEGVQYGLSLKARPDRKSRIRFDKWVDIALQNTREQRPGINVNDAMRFSQLLDAGADLDEVIKMFDYVVVKNGEQAVNDRNQSMQVQGEEQRKTDAQKAQIELAKIKAEGDQKFNEEMLRAKIKESETNKQIAADLYKSLREEEAAERGINISGSR
jgi:hypothetical protein